MLHHRPFRRFCQPLSANRILLRIKVPAGHDLCCRVHWRDDVEKNAMMYMYACMRRHIYYQVELELKTPWRCAYYFSIEEHGQPIQYVRGASADDGCFVYGWTVNDLYNPPCWIEDAVFYAIFPDRFCNGDFANDPPNVKDWEAPPAVEGFWGGDLLGIKNKIPHLRGLGINAVWLNPVFAASSNHRYNTRDYLTVDPALGDNQTLRDLTGELHNRGIRIILDGVFNHTGTDFFAFKDIIDNGAASPYRLWYHIHRYPVRVEDGADSYQCWWNIGSLPKLRVENPEVAEYLLHVGTHWLEEAGIDGWRLDVPNEIGSWFWQSFRSRIKSVHPDAYIVGEIWKDARYWLLNRLFDGVMNYPFRDLIIGYFANRRLTLSKLDASLGAIRLRYPEPLNFALLNLLGSHDTARIITVFQKALAERRDHTGTYHEAVEHLRPVLILQFTYPGAPMIYYGDEVGLTGGPDPDCRAAMPWDESQWDRDLLSFYHRLIALRQTLLPLRRGFFQPCLVDDLHDTLVFFRRLGDQWVLVIINASDQCQSMTIDLQGVANGRVLHDGMSGRTLELLDAKLCIDIQGNFGAVLWEDAP